MTRIIVVASLASCAGTPPTSSWSFDKDAGMAVVTQERACVTFRNSNLAPNTRLQLVDPTANHVVVATIAGPLAACVDPVSDVPPVSGYAIRFDAEPPPLPFFGIAIAGSAVGLQRVDSAITSDLDGDSRPEHFRACTSSEGVHFTIWSGAALTGTRRWHGYRYLGYDVSPTCTADEMAASPPG